MAGPLWIKDKLYIDRNRGMPSVMKGRSCTPSTMSHTPRARSSPRLSKKLPF